MPVKSHSTRSEWIEILVSAQKRDRFYGLTPHGVSGLKLLLFLSRQQSNMSHSTRSEWIEILSFFIPPILYIVSLHTE